MTGYRDNSLCSPFVCYVAPSVTVYVPWGGVGLLRWRCATVHILDLVGYACGAGDLAPLPAELIGDPWSLVLVVGYDDGTVARKVAPKPLQLLHHHGDLIQVVHLFLQALVPKDHVVVDLGPQ